jgi:hypothetical protein
MNIIELAKQAGIEDAHFHAPHPGVISQLKSFAALVEAAARADERESIMKSIEELRPVENNPLLQNKPASFWIENFRQIVYARGTT